MVVRVSFLAILLLRPLEAIGATIVLVHGAFVGSWYWNPVAEGLREMGHTVVAVDLNAHQKVERAADVTLADHIAIIVAAIEAQDNPVVLVSHSYGGRPSTGAWDIARDQISAVIFVEAVAPYGTGNLALPEDKRQRMALANSSPEALVAGVLAPPAYLFARYPGQELYPHSLSAAHGAVPLTLGDLPSTPGAYVLGSNSTAEIFKQYAQKVSIERNWTVWEIESGHDMVDDAADVLTHLIDMLSSELVAADQE